MFILFVKLQNFCESFVLNQWFGARIKLSKYCDFLDCNELTLYSPLR